MRGASWLDQGCNIPSFPLVSNSSEQGGSGRAGRSDHVTHVTEDGVVMACGGESADGTDDLSCLALDLGGPEPAWTWHR